MRLWVQYGSKRKIVLIYEIRQNWTARTLEQCGPIFGNCVVCNTTNLEKTKPITPRTLVTNYYCIVYFTFRKSTLRFDVKPKWQSTSAVGSPSIRSLLARRSPDLTTQFQSQIEETFTFYRQSDSIYTLRFSDWSMSFITNESVSKRDPNLVREYIYSLPRGRGIHRHATQHNVFVVALWKSIFRQWMTIRRCVKIAQRNQI